MRRQMLGRFDYDRLIGALCASAPNFWTYRFEKEKREAAEQRRALAAQMCMDCPVLDACREYRDLSVEMQLPVDGVVAGSVLMDEED